MTSMPAFQRVQATSRCGSLKGNLVPVRRPVAKRALRVTAVQLLLSSTFLSFAVIAMSVTATMPGDAGCWTSSSPSHQRHPCAWSGPP
ncbi:hypothetical protein HaLaN_10381 [Haematococcus lacustris]|uniref:Uncharacterized protein n=1 Tax=Haematococcus lacustris TaxID=44745 RepID=A0A699Z4Y5_HAELA|nr:hypothetical protein HaLaN_10381 [Haematococcus lacustris]